MIVISPWSKGGWVNSEVFDHTSLIRFIDRRFGRQYPGHYGVEYYDVAARGGRRSYVGV
ncbi:alkaline phosphatase family protein [Acidobacterium sp. S8]|uniref:alkaline phosphatase family protein n=1 Tax=Acidobacterium sp. S8 TaxID=1641854 RepID=UPI0020B11E64|nr:alkaline phosphatase family protein [Acidobacterium sp. S8]